MSSDDIMTRIELRVATRAPVGVHTTPWKFTPPTQRQRSRALLI